MSNALKLPPIEDLLGKKRKSASGSAISLPPIDEVIGKQEAPAHDNINNEDIKQAMLEWGQEHMDPNKGVELLFNVTAPIAEFLQFGHDVVVSVPQDLYYKGKNVAQAVSSLIHGDFTGAKEALGKAGNFPLTTRTIRELPKYFPGGDEPKRPPSMSEFLLNVGLPGWAAGTVGFALDVALDPFTWLSGGEAAAFKVAEKQLAKYPELGIKSLRVLTPKEINEIADRLPDSPLKTSLKLAAKAKSVNQTLTPAGLAKALIPATVRKAVGKGVIETLDKIPVPFAKDKLVAESGKGIGVREEPVSFLKWITPRGKYEELKYAGTPHAQVAKELFGGGDILNPSTARAGKYDYAYNISRHLQAIQLRATKDMYTEFKRYVGKSPEELDTVFKDLDHMAASFADKVGPALFAKFTPEDNILSYAERVRKTRLFNLEETPTTKKYLAQVKAKLRNYEKAYGLPSGSLDNVFDSFVRNYWATHVLTGYYLTGMHVLEGIVRGSLNDIKSIAGVKDDGEALSYAWRAIWSNSIAKVPPREVDKKIFDLIKKKWTESELDKVYATDFKDYINSLYSGYLRRVIPVKSLGTETAAELLKRAADSKFRIYPVKWLDATNLVNATQRVLGQEAADKLAATLALRGDGAISTETIAKITGANIDDVFSILKEAGMVPSDVPVDAIVKNLSSPYRKTGFIERFKQTFGDEAAARVEQAIESGNVSLDDIANATGIDKKRLSNWLRKTYNIGGVEIERALQDVITNQGVRPVANMEIGAQKWQERKVPEEALGAYLADAGLQERMIAYAQAAGRTIRSQEFIRSAYGELKNAGLIFDKPPPVVKGKRLFDKYGVEYIKVPNDPDLWGPLAGKFIPRYVADPMLKVVEIGDAGWATSALSAWRQMALSSPDTVARNIESGIDMMLRAGITPTELSVALKQVVPDYMKFLRTGKPVHFGPGWEYLNLYAEGKLYGEALERADEEFLKQFVNLGGKNVIAKLGEGVKNVVQNHPISPLVWFERSEDIMRLAAYKVAFNRLVKAGVSADEAGRAAAHVANNILFNYANQPAMTTYLRRYGLAAFPAFPYFNISRTWRIATERPLTINISDYAVNSLNVASANDPDELRRRFALVHGTYMQNEKPLIAKVGDKYYYIPLSQIISTSATDPTQTINEVATLGLMRTALSLLYTAMNEGETPPWEAKYGRKVYDPYETTFGKLIQSAKFAGQQAMPGLPRKVGDLAGAAYHAMIGDVNNDLYFSVMGKNYDKTVEEALLNFLISTRQIGPMYAIRQERNKAYSCQSRASGYIRNIIVSGLSPKEKARKIRLVGQWYSRCLRDVNKR